MIVRLFDAERPLVFFRPSFTFPFYTFQLVCLLSAVGITHFEFWSQSEKDTGRSDRLSAVRRAAAHRRVRLGFFVEFLTAYQSVCVCVIGYALFEFLSFQDVGRALTICSIPHSQYCAEFKVNVI